MTAKTPATLDNTHVTTRVFKKKTDDKLRDPDLLALLNNAFRTKLTSFVPNSADDGAAVIFELRENTTKKLIGVAVASQMRQFVNDEDFDQQGGNLFKGEGILITSVAGSSMFSHVTERLFSAIETCARNSFHNYLMLHALKHYPVDYLVPLLTKLGFKVVEFRAPEKSTLMVKDLPRRK